MKITGESSQIIEISIKWAMADRQQTAKSPEVFQTARNGFAESWSRSKAAAAPSISRVPAGHEMVAAELEVV